MDPVSIIWTSTEQTPDKRSQVHPEPFVVWANTEKPDAFRVKTFKKVKGSSKSLPLTVKGLSASQDNYLKRIMKLKSVINVQIPTVCLFASKEALNEGREFSSARYKRQVDVGYPSQTTEQTEHGDLAEEKRTRTVPFAFVPKNYVRLEENGSRQKAEEKKSKRKKKYNKCKKNVGKALRYSWKCLMLGLQNLTVGYCIPLTAAGTFYAEFQGGMPMS
ncbi:uncharacterized protein si:dkey-126g1.9 [Electrophorus electricus]|uniref:uncharacterized protein si:dkey-126g1.9 n=1 Tax=Electrophorus electricus TaxID=8005 RepID=UPI0015D0CC4C|nr:uncharacterized protein si:dkey-126g1.9 [Electrophorus electricus]